MASLTEGARVRMVTRSKSKPTGTVSTVLREDDERNHTGLLREGTGRIEGYEIQWDGVTGDWEFSLVQPHDVEGI